MEPSWRDGSDWEFKVNVTNSLVLEFRKVNYRVHKLEAPRGGNIGSVRSV